MKQQASAWPINNPMAYLRGELTDYLLAVNGFSSRGGDFEQFRKLCACGDRMPKHSALLTLEEVLHRRFFCQLPCRSAHANAIWRAASDLLLLEEGVAADPMKLPALFAHPDHLYAEDESLWDFAFLGEQADSWQAWKNAAKEVFEAEVAPQKVPTVTVFAKGDLVKPNLYRVERHLRGEEPNPSLWNAQLALFACGICAERGLRCGFRLDGSKGAVEWLLSMLRYVSAHTPLPPLLLSGASLTHGELTALCKLILEKGSLAEGVLPVMLVKKA